MRQVINWILFLRIIENVQRALPSGLSKLFKSHEDSCLGIGSKIQVGYEALATAMLQTTKRINFQFLHDFFARALGLPVVVGFPLAATTLPLPLPFPGALIRLS